MAKLKAYVESINNQLKNKELLPKKIWMLLSKSLTGFFMKFFSQSRHFFILDLGKGSEQNLYNLHNYDNPSDYAKKSASENLQKNCRRL
jgi:hypothetical protein